ncbi:hypothetical protein V8C35DRAFT_298291 [Trichoderma chlorosporum]
MVQRTFTIVPPAGPAERSAADSRPMTSKQVRKAYREANRVPRVSKAELLRQERAEQERIRKEFEKEKAALKAKTLREKKRAKEQAERDEKKKKGLPLVNVRPSQDTIARFVRGNGLGIKRDFKGQNAVTTPVLPIVEEPEEDDDDFPSPKRLCSQEPQTVEGCAEEDVEAPEENREVSFPAFEEPIEEPTEEPAKEPAEEHVTKPDAVPEKPKSAAEDDFFEGFEIMSDDEMSKLSFNQVPPKNSMSSTKDYIPAAPDATPGEEGKCHLLHEITLPEPDSPISIKNPKPSAPLGFDLISDDEEDLEQEMLALDAALNSQQKLSKKPTQEPVLPMSQKPVRNATGYEMDLGLTACHPNETSQETRTARHEQARLMPPPPIPAAPQRSCSPRSPVAVKPQAPPLSTQQILFNMDDFFPSSSQQAAELEEEATFISQPIKPCSIPEPRAPSLVQEKDAVSPNAVSSSPEPPKPFFTASGSNERLAVAILRSRRTAEREEEQRRRALQLEAIELEEAMKKESERRVREKRLAANKLNSTIAQNAASKTEPHQKGQAPRQARPVTATTPQFSTRKGFTASSNRTPANISVHRTPLVETLTNTIFPAAKAPPAAETNKKDPPRGTFARQQSTSIAARVANTKLPPEAQNQRHETPKREFNKENIASPGLGEVKHPIASQESEFGGSWMDELATELSL